MIANIDNRMYYNLIFFVIIQDDPSLRSGWQKWDFKRSEESFLSLSIVNWKSRIID